MTNARTMRRSICRWGRSLFERGLTPGSSGNLSSRLADGTILMTPTESCLGFLDPARLSLLDSSGAHLDGALPTKEAHLHLAIYEARPAAAGVVHLHSPHATALSCLDGLDRDNAIMALTPYTVMRVGRVPLLPYRRPGDAGFRDEIHAEALDHACLLLASHGPIASGVTFEAAVFAAEELEEAARLIWTARSAPMRMLNASEIAELKALGGAGSRSSPKQTTRPSLANSS